PGPSPAFRPAMRSLCQDADTCSHNTPQRHFPAVLTLALLVSTACTLGCSSTVTSSPAVPAPPPPPAPTSVSVSITPLSASLLLGTTQTFTPRVAGATDTAVSWSVNGVAG